MMGIPIDFGRRKWGTCGSGGIGRAQWSTGCCCMRWASEEELHRASQDNFQLRLFWGVLDRYLTEVHVKKPQLEGGFDRMGEDAAATARSPIAIILAIIAKYFGDLRKYLGG